jgi:hypothetical protein
MGRESDAKKWLDEARQRVDEQKQVLADLKPEPGESDEHFAARKQTEQDTLERREKIQKNLRKKLDAIRKAKELDTNPDPDQDGLATFDGKVAAAWIVTWLEKSRKAGWTGTVTSGYRTPEYSTSLCIAMCGAPSCPGRCAGASSNHSGKVYPAGAVDVTDYTRFGQIQPQIGSPLRNDLPIDPVHYSVSGH